VCVCGVHSEVRACVCVCMRVRGRERMYFCVHAFVTVCFISGMYVSSESVCVCVYASANIVCAGERKSFICMHVHEL